MVYLIVIVVICAGLLLLYRFAGITFNGLPVLMYHQVISSGATNDLMVSTEQLDIQFRYLLKKKYTSIFLSDLLDHENQNKALPKKPVLLSFDDGYKNNFTNLYPLLEKYKLKGNIFLVAGFINTSENEDTGTAGFLHVNDIRSMNSETIEFGLHSYDHKSYNDLTVSQIEEDIINCRTRLNELAVPYQPCLAYTYGAYPKKDATKRIQMFDVLRSNGIQLAFRIGNRINKLPLSNKFLLQRVDIRGDESFIKFKLALIIGKKILLK